ncbi:hypothetical protein DET47_12922 [Shewanella putrefaciens]|nr:hypothetical protein DET47_12922 [Shewanella putrefaciens]
MDLDLFLLSISSAFIKFIDNFLSTTAVPAFAVLLSVHLTNKANERRLKIQFNNDTQTRTLALKTEKLEELYLLVKEWEDNTHSSLYFLTPYAQCTIESDKLTEMIKKNEMICNLKYQRIQVLINLYFATTELSNFFDEFTTAKLIAFSYIDTANWGIKAGMSGYELNAAIQTVHEKSILLNNAIMQYSLKLISDNKL